jgi:hypothetical protein
MNVLPINLKAELVKAAQLRPDHLAKADRPKS